MLIIQVELMKPLLKAGMMALLTVNAWREARLWLQAAVVSQLEATDELAIATGLWWFRAHGEVDLDDLHLYLEAGLGHGQGLPPISHGVMLRLQVRVSSLAPTAQLFAYNLKLSTLANGKSLLTF